MNKVTWRFWAAAQLRDYLDKLIVCGPRPNTLICSSENKNDHLDTIRLCSLLWWGALKSVWTPKQLVIPRFFYIQMKEYQRLVKTMSFLKRQLMASLHNCGVNKAVLDGDYRDPSAITDHQLWEIDEIQKMSGIGPEGRIRSGPIFKTCTGLASERN